MIDRAPDAQPTDSIRAMFANAENLERFWNTRVDEYEDALFNAKSMRHYWELEADRLAGWIEIREAEIT